MNSRLTTALVVLGTAAALPLRGQSLQYIRHSGGYAALGFGGGSFKLTCDSGCVGDRLTSQGATLTLGRFIGQRIRGELAFRYQNNSDAASNVFGASLGAAAYLVGGLHVRGAVSYQRASVEDSTGTYEGGGGPGFTVGTGYDLFVSRRTALTPYVSFTTGSISKLDRKMLGGTSQTSGSLSALHFGVSLARVSGQYTCVTSAGVPVTLSRRSRSRFLSCLTEVEARLGRSSGFKR